MTWDDLWMPCQGPSAHQRSSASCFRYVQNSMSTFHKLKLLLGNKTVQLGAKLDQSAHNHQEP